MRAGIDAPKHSCMQVCTCVEEGLWARRRKDTCAQRRGASSAVLQRDEATAQASCLVACRRDLAASLAVHHAT
eukprot:5933587-Pleurochrysis_carterae.AAC.3